MRDASEIERAVATFANAANGGLIVTASPLATFHRDLIKSWQPALSYPRSTTHASSLSPVG